MGSLRSCVTATSSGSVNINFFMENKLKTIRIARCVLAALIVASTFTVPAITHAESDMQGAAGNPYPNMPTIAP